jgi:hypothetical protein
MSTWALWLCMIFLIGAGIAADVPFVFDETTSDMAGYSPSQLEQVRLSSPDLAGVPAVTQVAENEVLDFPITGGGNLPERSIGKNVSELKKTLDAAVEPDNPRVHEEAVVLALKYPGDLTIDQIDSIYNYIKYGDSSKIGWGYVRDPRGLDYFNYANDSLRLGDRANCVGGGDCDDFAILMAALVESIGGTTRIILARNNTTGGHAYTEVYLGQLNGTGSQVETIIDWLKGKFNTSKIYTHIDTDTKDVWLNLDWGSDEKGNAHPGGPFFTGDMHIVLCIRDNFAKSPLKLSEAPRETVVDQIWIGGYKDSLIVTDRPDDFDQIVEIPELSEGAESIGEGSFKFNALWMVDYAGEMNDSLSMPLDSYARVFITPMKSGNVVAEQLYPDDKLQTYDMGTVEAFHTYMFWFYGDMIGTHQMRYKMNGGEYSNTVEFYVKKTAKSIDRKGPVITRDSLGILYCDGKKCPGVIKSY